MPIKDKILANTVAKNTMPLKISENKEDIFTKSVGEIVKEGCGNNLGKTLARITTNPHPDLMYGSAILVSTVINRNDDVFLPSETWNARNTPVNTPYNDQHIAQDIIGHIIASRVLARDGSVYDGVEPPDYFDIEVDFVAYKEIFPELISEIAEGALKGSKFVSMEATMKDFDYCLVSSVGELKVVKRNEHTAFLTKYLRIYGGPGLYNGERICRVLRDFRFNGMGNVDTPANPDSCYTSIDNIDAKECEVIESISKEFLYVTKGKIMTIETLEQAKALIETLTTEKTDLEARIAALETAAKTSSDELTSTKASLTVANDTVTAEKTKAELAEKKIGELSEQITAKEAELKSVKEELSKATSEIEKARAAEKLAARLAKLKEVGVDISDAEASKIGSMSDETFASIVEFSEAIAKKMKDKNKEDNKDNKDNKDDKSKAELEAEEKEKAEAAAKAELEKAEQDKQGDVTATAGDVPNDAEKLKSVASELVSVVRVNRKTRKIKN